MRFSVSIAAMCLAVSAAAQTAPAHSVDVQTDEAIQARIPKLVAEAQASPQGMVIMPLEKYPGHYTELFVRTKDGGGEEHAVDNDFFIVEEGEATLVTGGTIVGAKEISPGETRGSKVEGGDLRLIRKGDVVHIAPGIPHQILLAPGKTFAYYLMKVATPKP